MLRTDYWAAAALEAAASEAAASAEAASEEAAAAATLGRGLPAFTASASAWVLRPV